MSSLAQPKILVWFLAAAGLFFARALLFSTWLSRAPEVQREIGEYSGAEHRGCHTEGGPLSPAQGVQEGQYDEFLNKSQSKKGFERAPSRRLTGSRCATRYVTAQAPGVRRK